MCHAAKIRIGTHTNFDPFNLESLDGLVAPKGLDQQMDAEEASRDAKKAENAKNKTKKAKEEAGDSADESE
ncbi:unnamed protein product [Strongylus vulgaris]|uniref:Uncharacterized protein n=1 Tax=Strongylus vulgaris TaxID=40348 RepID=A0A3P7KJZ8_STRVU|nr:unnamed protein product [Strongylus vulgaris]